MIKDHSWISAAVLLLVGAAVFLPALGQEESVNGTEAIHAEIARNMLENGDYLVPRLTGRPYIDKPPLFNWSVAALFRLTGRVDFTQARLPSAICSIAAMLGIYFLGRRWCSARAGVYAALIWGTSWLVVEWGRFGQMDMMMTCLIFYAVFLADVAAAQERRGSRLVAWLAASALIAAATLSKTPAALLYFFVGAACLWRVRRGRWLPNLSLLLLTAAVTGIAWAAWLVPAERQHPGHIRELVHYQFGEGPTEHPARITLYFDQLLIRTAPWTFFAVGAGWWAVRRVRRCGYDLAAAPALFSAVCLVIMTAFPNKREHYLLPMLPMWSLLLGGFLDRTLTLRREGGREHEAELPSRWLFNWPLRLSLALLWVGAAALAVYWAVSASRRLAAGILLCAAVAAAATWGLAAARRARDDRALAMLFLAWFLVMATAYPLTLEVFNPAMADMAQLRRAAQMIPAGAPVAVCDFRSPYLFFRLNRPLTYVDNLKAACEFLNHSEQGRRYLLLSGSAADTVASMTWVPVRRAGTFDLGNSVLVVLESGVASQSHPHGGRQEGARPLPSRPTVFNNPAAPHYTSAAFQEA
jgi:4-amino-4-deoxy-L-arabinose transferase-like glycosyltransferase